MSVSAPRAEGLATGAGARGGTAATGRAGVAERRADGLKRLLKIGVFFVQPVVVEGKDFVAVTQQFQYRTAAPGKKTGSVWKKVLVFESFYDDIYLK